MALTFEDVQNSGLMGDQGVAATPAAQPLPPNQPPSASAPPYTPPATTFGFNPTMQNALQKAGIGAQIMKKADSNVPAPGDPGGWAKSILASAQQVLAGVGDISTTPTNQPESKAGSFFEGLAQTVKNRNEREQNQKQQEFENQQKTEATKQAQQRIDIEKQQSDSVIAHNNIENLHTLRLIHDMGSDQIDKQIARDKTQIDEYKEDDPTSEIYSDMSKEDIYKKMDELQAKDPHDPNHPLVLQPFITRQIDTGKSDADGNPIMDTRYSLFRVPEKRKLGDSLAKAANKYGLQGPGGTEFSPDDELFGHQINTLTKNITMAQTAEDAVTKLAANSLSDKEAKDVQDTIADQKFDGDWIKILDAAKKNSNGDVNPNSVLQVAANGIKDSKGNVVVPPVKNANDVVAEKFGGRAAFDKMLDYQNRLDIADTNAEARIQEESAKRAAIMSNGQDPFGNQAQVGGTALTTDQFMKERNKFYDSQPVKNVDKLQASYQQFNSIVDGLQAKADKDGNIKMTDETLTGPQGLAGLFDAVGVSTTPLQGGGLRLNKAFFDEHQNARSLGQKLQALFDNTKTGTPITTKQLLDYVDIARQAYIQQYVDVGNNQRQVMNYMDKLPYGNGHEIDPVNHQIFLTLSNNNPQLAAAAEAKSGWQPSTAPSTKYTGATGGPVVVNGVQFPSQDAANQAVAAWQAQQNQSQSSPVSTQQITNMSQVAAKAAQDAAHKSQTHGAK